MRGTVAPASTLSCQRRLCTYDPIMIYRCGLDVIVVWFVLILIVLVPVENGDFVVWNAFSLGS